MKNKRFLLIASCALLSLSLISSCSENKKPEGGDDKPPVTVVLPDEVTKLEIISSPNKVTYKEGEFFNPAGLKLEATLGDGSKEDASIGDCEIYPSTELTKDVTSVRIVYFEGEVVIPITVNANPCVSLEMINAPAVYSYIQGTKLNLAGLQLKATLEDSSITKDNVTNYELLLDGEPYSTRDPLNVEVGEHVLTFKYREQSVDYKILIFKGSIVEAENIIQTELMTIDSRNFVEKTSSSYSFRKVSSSSEPASNNAYIGYIRKGDVLRIHVWSEENQTSNLILRGASASVKTYPNDDSSKPPVETNDILIGDVASIDINGVPYELTEKHFLPGGKSRFFDEGGGDSLLWVKWQDADLGNIELAKGDNTITINTTTAKSFKDFNIDRIEVRSLGE